MLLSEADSPGPQLLSDGKPLNVNVMKTSSYNPSPLEVEFANILEGLTDEINRKFKNFKIEDTAIQLDLDNPVLNIAIVDDDGDKHSLAIKIIQRPDTD